MSWRNNPTRVAVTTHANAMEDMPSGVTLCPSRRGPDAWPGPRKSAGRQATSLRVLAPAFRVLRLPLAASQRSNRQFLDRFRIDTSCVHADAIRMRPRHVERFDAAHGTEPVLGRASNDTVRPARLPVANE